MEVAAASPLTARTTPTGTNQNGATSLFSPRPPALQQPVPPLTPGPGSMLVAIPGLFSPTIAPNQSYPPPLAKHPDVVASKELFLDTLQKFHIALGTRLVIPKMGGKDLDLHVLYVEVTQRGGLQQVIKDRKWKEITGAFNFPRTTTSASYVLRKYYITLLHHYEQLYFFGSSGLLVSPPTPLGAPSPLPVNKQMEHHAPAPEAHAEEPEAINKEGKKIRRRRLAPMPAMAPVDPTASVGNVVTGAIEGKFEHGYLVTVLVGTEKLRGVIYHIPPGSRGPQHAHIPSFMLSPSNADVMKLPETTIVPAKERKRKRREELKKDPNAPRSSRTGYNFFFAEERAKLKLLHPEKERELSRMIGDAWNSLTEEQKMPYQERGAKDKERYEKEMREYRQTKSSQQAGSSTPILQKVRPEAAEAATANAGDTDHQVAGVESNPKPAPVPVIPPQRQQQQQQVVNSSQSASEQRSSQQYPPNTHQSATTTESTALPQQNPESPKVVSEGTQAGSDSQPVAQQFMN